MFPGVAGNAIIVIVIVQAYVNAIPLNIPLRIYNGVVAYNNIIRAGLDDHRLAVVDKIIVFDERSFYSQSNSLGMVVDVVCDYPELTAGRLGEKNISGRNPNAWCVADGAVGQVRLSRECGNSRGAINGTVAGIFDDAVVDDTTGGCIFIPVLTDIHIDNPTPSKSLVFRCKNNGCRRGALRCQGPIDTNVKTCFSSDVLLKHHRDTRLDGKGCTCRYFDISDNHVGALGWYPCGIIVDGAAHIDSVRSR